MTAELGSIASKFIYIGANITDKLGINSIQTTKSPTTDNFYVRNPPPL